MPHRCTHQPAHLTSFPRAESRTRPGIRALAVAAIASFAFGCQTGTESPPYTPPPSPGLPAAGSGGAKAPVAGATTPTGGVGGSVAPVIPVAGTSASAGAPAAGAGGSVAVSAAGTGAAGSGGAAGGGAAGASEPSFTALYNKELGACQNPSCHSSDDPAVRLAVDMRTRDSAYKSLVNQMGTGACAGKGVLVMPGSPEMSLMYLKLNIEGAPRQPCGGPMPPGGTFNTKMGDAIKAWIMAGAKDN
jgi:hypothetical protein